MYMYMYGCFGSNGQHKDIREKAQCVYIYRYITSECIYIYIYIYIYVYCKHTNVVRRRISPAKLPSFAVYIEIFSFFFLWVKTHFASKTALSHTVPQRGGHSTKRAKKKIRNDGRRSEQLAACVRPL